MKAGANALVIVSGGMDSATLLYATAAMRDLGLLEEVHAVGVDYGQRHRCELERAAALAGEVGASFEQIDFQGLGDIGGSALTDVSQPVPHGHYEDWSMKETVVPNRNMILLAIAGAVAVKKDCDLIAYGAHAGDHAIYPDCRREFADRLAEAFLLCDYKPRTLVAPFVEMTKAEICALGHRLHVPFETTWSCYEGTGDKHCGKCGTCVERIEAFEVAGVPDPTIYKVR